MAILTISGSSRISSSNVKLLTYLPTLFPNYSFHHYDQIVDLPLFKTDEDQAPWSENVLHWRTAIQQTDALIICTPEYLHNLPALIKNALEWLTSSGELMGKPVLPITFTPNPPRGEKAMQSLLWSLKALDSRIVGQLALYQSEINMQKEALTFNEESMELLKSGMALLNH